MPKRNSKKLNKNRNSPKKEKRSKLSPGTSQVYYSRHPELEKELEGLALEHIIEVWEKVKKFKEEVKEESEKTKEKTPAEIYKEEKEPQKIISKARLLPKSPHILDLKKGIPDSEKIFKEKPKVQEKITEEITLPKPKKYLSRTLKELADTKWQAAELAAEVPKEKIKKEKKEALRISVSCLKPLLIKSGKAISLPFKFLFKALNYLIHFLDLIIDQSLKLFYGVIKIFFLLLTRAILWLVNSFVGIISQIKSRISFSNRSYIRQAAFFLVMALILSLPFFVYDFYTRIKTTQGEVLGAATLGLNYFNEAGEALFDSDFKKAEKGFQKSFYFFQEAEKYFKDLGFLSNEILNSLSEISSGRELVTIGELSAEIGQHLSSSLAKLEGIDFKEEVNEDEIELIPTEALEVLGEVKNNLLLVLLDIQEIQSHLEKVDLRVIPQENQESFQKIKVSLPYLEQNFQKFIPLVDIILEISGFKESKRYLLVFQNNAELRPSGGFMGSYALMDIDQGKIKSLEIPGGGFYDLKGSLAVRVKAPQPFHIFSPFWQIWNANWFFDFPSSAYKLIWFYEKSGGSSLDGVITFTPQVIEDMLHFTGPIEIEAYGKTITYENFRLETQVSVELEYDKEKNQPKAFIADLTPLLLKRLLEINDEEFLDLILNIYQALKEKHILIYFNDSKMQKKVEDFDWAGKIKSYPKDFLAVVHTNIAGGKTDLAIQEKITHQAQVDESGYIIDTVSVTRSHQGRENDVFEGVENLDYIRFYVPENSILISAQGFEGPGPQRFQEEEENIEPDPLLSKLEREIAIDEASGTRISKEYGLEPEGKISRDAKTVFGNWMRLKPSETKTVSVSYRLPFKLFNLEKSLADQFLALFGEKEKNAFYSLYVQKQPGTKSPIFESKLTLPKEWEISNFYPAKSPSLVKDLHELKFNTDLRIDRFYGAVVTK